MAKGTKIGRAANRTPGISISDPKFLDTPPPSLGGAWSGSIARFAHLPFNRAGLCLQGSGCERKPGWCHGRSQFDSGVISGAG